MRLASNTAKLHAYWATFTASLSSRNPHAATKHIERADSRRFSGQILPEILPADGYLFAYGEQ
jgi:hypothetical protein